MSRHALVTGGAGFVGSHLVDRLLADGWSVEVIDSLLTGSEENLAGAIASGKCVLTQADVRDPFSALTPPDVVFHLASPASPKDYLEHPILTMITESNGTLHALEVAKEHGATFLFASTSEIYGDPIEHPQKEEHRGNVSCIGPRSVYDEGKRFAEALTMAYKREHGVDVRLARLFNTFGPRMRLGDGRVVPAFIDAALRGQPLPVFGDGQQTRSLCYVDDTVDGLIRLATLPGLSGEVVNIGNPDERTILQIAREIVDDVSSQVTGAASEGINIVHLPPMEDDPMRRCPDISRARRLLDWEPKFTTRQGLTRTIAYFVARQSS